MFEAEDVLQRQPVDVLIEVTAGRGVVAWWGLSRPRSTDGNMSSDECQMRDPSNNTIQITTLHIGQVVEP